MTLDAILPASGVGFIGGLLVGTTGVGAGSVIAALLLVFYPGVTPHVVVGSATVQAVAMKLVGVAARHRLQLGERRLGLGMAAGAAPLGIAGAYASHFLAVEALRSVLASALTAVGAFLVIQSIRDRGRRESAGGKGDPPLAKVSLVGAIVGFIAGMTSIGTGTLFVTALAGTFRIGAHRAVAAALVAGLVTLVMSGATHLALGHVDGALVIGTCLGSIPGVLLGTALSARLPARSLRGVIGGGIVIAAIIALMGWGR